MATTTSTTQSITFVLQQTTTTLTESNFALELRTPNKKIFVYRPSEILFTFVAPTEIAAGSLEVVIDLTNGGEGLYTATLFLDNVTTIPLMTKIASLKIRKITNPTTITTTAIKV